MKIIRLSQADVSILNTLPEFEAQFWYPLKETKFSIDHGPDYSAFFASIGAGDTFLAVNKGIIEGMLSFSFVDVAVAPGETQKAIYTGNLRVLPTSSKGRILLALLSAVVQYVQTLPEADRPTLAYCVVMAGTEALPTCYTGRLGFPTYENMRTLNILRFEASTIPLGKSVINCGEAEGWRLFTQMTPFPRPATQGKSEYRSQMVPIWLNAGNSAVGMVEDTRCAKRLFLTSGDELSSAHLSYFSFTEGAYGADLIRSAIGIAQKNGLLGLFLAVSESQYNSLKKQDLPSHTVAQAHIFSPNPMFKAYPINTAEI